MLKYKDLKTKHKKNYIILRKSKWLLLPSLHVCVMCINRYLFLDAPVK